MKCFFIFTFVVTVLGLCKAAETGETSDDVSQAVAADDDVSIQGQHRYCWHTCRDLNGKYDPATHKCCSRLGRCQVLRGCLKKREEPEPEAEVFAEEAEPESNEDDVSIQGQHRYCWHTCRDLNGKYDPATHKCCSRLGRCQVLRGCLKKRDEPEAEVVAEEAEPESNEDDVSIQGQHRYCWHTCRDLNGKYDPATHKCCSRLGRCQVLRGCE